MDIVTWLLDRLERTNHLPQGSVIGAYEDGEFHFYKNDVLAGRYPRDWTAMVIHYWSSKEEGILHGQH